MKFKNVIQFSDLAASVHRRIRHLNRAKRKSTEMATFRRWRRERNRRRSHSPECSLDIKDFDFKINRYQKSNWADTEAKEAHASVVQYLWRKEYELKNKINDLKKQIATNVDNKLHKTIEIESQESEKRGITKRETEAPMRGIHFRTIEDKTFDKLNFIKSDRNLDRNESYIKKIRSKVNPEIEDDLSEDFKNIIRGKSANHISAALLSESRRVAKEARLRALEKWRNKQRNIYDIMADRNKLGISYDDNHEHQPHERKWHAERDYRWNDCDYLNLVGYRMQNEKPCGFSMQNRGEIIW